MSVRLVMSAAAGYALVGALERSLSLVIMPITTRLFAPIEFSQLIAINNFTSLLNLTVGLFFVRGLPALLAAQDDEWGQRDAATTVFAATTVLGVFIISLGWWVAPLLGAFLNQPPTFPGLMRLAVCAIVMLLLGQSLNATARSLEHHKAAVTAMFTAFLVQAGSVFSLLLIFREGLASIYLAQIAGAVTMFAVLFMSHHHWISGRPKRSQLAKSALLSSQILSLNIGALVILNSAGLILNWAEQPREAALFGVATGAASVGMIGSVAFNGAWTPYVLRRAKDPTLPDTARRTFTLFSVAFLVAGAMGALFAHEVFSVLVGDAFLHAYRLVPPLIGCYALFAFANCFGQGILLRDNPHKFAWIGLATAAVFLLVAVPAVHSFGAFGITLAMACSFSVMIACMQVAAHVALPIGYPWGRHAILWGVASIPVGLAAYLPMGWSTVAVKLAVLAGLVAVAVVAGPVDIGALVRTIRPRAGVGTS
ncbi:MAG: lipopolysaccharide biosynthesis protein [Hyphomicrobiaceae bacterium]